MSHWRKDHTRFYNILKLLMTLFRHGTGCLFIEPAKKIGQNQTTLSAATYFLTLYKYQN